MKVSQAKVCLSCDSIYDIGQSCPICGEEEFVFLSTYFKPLSSEKIKEVKEDGKESSDPLQMVGKVKHGHYPNPKFSDGDCSKYFDPAYAVSSPSQPNRFAPDYNPEPPKPKTGEGHNTGGIRVERKGYFVCWRNRVNAGLAYVWEALCRLFQEGTLLSRKEYHCGNQDFVLLPTDISNVARGIK